jgi:tetratricopeptide (TPR) repeat protein
MNILQLFGLLLVVNSLVCAAWFKSQGNLGAGGITLLAFALVAGLALIFYKREVTVSFGKEGATIKAAADQATTDAAEIAKVRARVEAQAATMDLVARDSAEAKKLLDELRKENALADEKLKLIEDKTAQITQLPDGRIKTGSVVSGDPATLGKHYTAMQTALAAGRTEEGYAEAKDCVRIYEETAKIISAGVSMTTGDVQPDSISRFYDVASVGAYKAGNADQALEWHTKAFNATPTAILAALQVVALGNAGKREEAQKLIDDTLKRNDSYSEEFKGKLLEMGVIKKQ